MGNTPVVYNRRNTIFSNDEIYFFGNYLRAIPILKNTAVLFYRDRVDAPDIAIVITDGLSRFPQLTRLQSERAKNESITMFAIGIGNDTEEHELEAIASGPQFKFSVGDYAALLKLDQVVAHRACGGTVSFRHVIL